MKSPFSNWKRLLKYLPLRTVLIVPFVLQLVTVFYDQNQKLQGIFSVNLDLKHIQTFLQSRTLCEGCRITIVDRQGQIITSSTEDPPFTFSPHLDSLWSSTRFSIGNERTNNCPLLLS
ncbi:MULTISPECIES: hypothetical protein [unclassified Roseofilum]|uniref:hypothetical protein n=1 Tax=unclassified Roseofilum TaxID=2620099 RepID=UPI001B1BA556|nr:MULTISPECIES: hypothetical protein [unclassified Roseofilum]MBP0009445.1 cache domain-containing protein [Roseofilum sp. Belize Diploria]MBP0035704.1 cache domain-containing protein [Roseofilum sp. Belize BBD 4]